MLNEKSKFRKLTQPVKRTQVAYQGKYYYPPVHGPNVNNFLQQNDAAPGFAPVKLI